MGQVRIAQIVGEDEDDIRSRVSFGFFSCLKGHREGDET